MSIAERIQRILRAEWNDRLGREPRASESVEAALREGDRELLHARELLAGFRREREDALDEVRRCEDAAAGALRAHDDARARTWLRLMREAESRAAGAAEKLDREYRRLEPLERAVGELRARIADNAERPRVPLPPMASPHNAIGGVPSTSSMTAPESPGSRSMWSAGLERVETSVAAIDETFGRLESRIANAEAGLALAGPLEGSDPVEKRFASLESTARVEALKERAANELTVNDDDALARLRRRMVNS